VDDTRSVRLTIKSGIKSVSGEDVTTGEYIAKFDTIAPDASGCRTQNY
jgi:hypothetical protein